MPGSKSSRVWTPAPEPAAAPPPRPPLPPATPLHPGTRWSKAGAVPTDAAPWPTSSSKVECSKLNQKKQSYWTRTQSTRQELFYKPAASMAAAPPPTLPDDLIEEILLRLPLDDPASLLCASLVCKTWSHIAKVQLKRAQLLQLIENAQLKLLENAQLQEEHNQLLQRRLASSSSRSASSRRRSASSRGGQPAAAQARPAWRY